MLRATTRLRFIEPQLASPVDEPPDGKHWIHEIKHDGYRSQVVVERGEARVFTRKWIRLERPVSLYRSERRDSLKRLVGGDAQSRIQFSDEFDGDGGDLFKACAEKELEGMVSKHSLAPSRSGRSKTWLKTKCFTESTFVVIGTDRDRKTGALRALLARDSAGLSCAGAAFIALAGAERLEFFAELERLAHLGQRLSHPG